MALRTVYQLEGVSVWGTRFPVKKTSRWSMGFYSTLAKAEKHKDEYVKYDMADEDSVSDVYCYIITEWEIDCDNGLDKISIRTYLKDGKLYERNYVDRDKVFRGRPKDKIRFKHGDIVEVYDHDELLLAIVDGEPDSIERVDYLRKRAVENGHLKDGEDLWMDYSDDQYMVYDLTGNGHSHIESQFVFPHNKPVSKKTRERLETAMATEF